MPPVAIFILMNDTCLDRLLKQRSALPGPSIPLRVLLKTAILSSAGIHACSLARCRLEACATLQRQKIGAPLNLPPPRGGIRSLSVAAGCLAMASRNISQAFIQNPTNS
jgi:hypothetical protein